MGFKKTSGVIAISNRVETSATDTYTQLELDLPLDTLNNEIFVVLAVDFGLAAPDMDTTTPGDSTVFCQLAVTSQDRIYGLEKSSILARGENHITYGEANNVPVAVAFSHMSNDTPTGDLDYMGIVATPNCYLGIDSAGNKSQKAVAMRMWGYRAKADAATYAALVQSEVLSS